MAEVAPIQPCLWFDNQAREAMDYYVDVFPNSQIIRIDEYPDESLDEHFEGMSGKVINGVFALNGVEFTCLDGGPQFTFNEAISFIVSCADQEGSTTTGRSSRTCRRPSSAAGARTGSA